MKSFLGAVTVLAVSGVAMAQGMDLFPELQGQFKSAHPIQTTRELQNETPNIDPSVKNGAELTETQLVSGATSMDKEENPYAQVQNDYDLETRSVTEQKANITADPFAVVNNMKNPADPSAEGNITVKLTNLKGVLPYARDFAYCFGDLVLTNDTNQKLESLTMELTYRDTPTIISFGSVDKKKTQKQALMLIGKACEDILSTPQVEVKSCKMPPQSEESCKRRVQFIPPNS